MSNHLDTEEYRNALNEKLTSLSEHVKKTAGGGQALAELTLLLHSMFEKLEDQVRYHQAESLLFQKLILAAPRLSESYDGYKLLCRQLEEKLGYDTK